MSNLLITDEYNGYEFRYPELLEISRIQFEDQMWFSREYDVKLDALELEFSLDEGQKHFLMKSLPMFIRYEFFVGDFWSDVYKKRYKAPEAQELAAVVEVTERAVHARFYRQLSEALRLDHDNHFLDFLNVPSLKSREYQLKEWLDSEDKLDTCLAYSLVEGVFLFSNFLGLRSFQMNGNNSIPVIVRGTIQSSLDEDLHSVALTTSINIEYKEKGTTFLADTDRYIRFINLCAVMYERECEIIDNFILGDSLNGISKKEFKDYVAHRFNVVLGRLGCPKLFDVVSEIGEKFERDVYAYKLTDFFTAGVGSEYEDNNSRELYKNAILEVIAQNKELADESV